MSKENYNENEKEVHQKKILRCYIDHRLLNHHHHGDTTDGTGKQIEMIYPKHQTSRAAGIDLQSAHVKPIIIQPGDLCIIPTGLHVEIPVGYYGSIETRSSYGRIGVSIPTGTIDSDYRGEIHVILKYDSVNFIKTDTPNLLGIIRQHAITIEYGDRIAQLIVKQYVTCQFQEVLDLNELSSTERGTGGFGSTDK